MKFSEMPLSADNGPLQIRVDSRVGSAWIDFYIFNRNYTAKPLEVIPVVDVVPQDDSEFHLANQGPLVVFGLSYRQAHAAGQGTLQQLMDDLWRCGIRPTEGSGSAGSLAATQAHLKDLQQLVFDDVRAKGRNQ